MKEYSFTRPLLSIHIPKCGGTSLTKVLSNWFGPRFYTHYFDEVNQKMPKRVSTKRFFFNSFRPDLCIHGHFNKKRGFGVTDYYPDVDQAITFVRNPIEVQLSVFFYNQKLKRSKTLFRDGNPFQVTDDIDEFLETSDPYFNLFCPHGMNAENLDWYFQHYFVHVGLIETFQRSLDLISEKLGKPKTRISIENESVRNATPSGSSVAVFAKKCDFELTLYNRALRENQ